MLTSIRYQQCVVLNIKRSTYYYHADLSCERARKAEDTVLSKDIERIFKASRNNYGTRKIKKESTKLAGQNKFQDAELVV